jgi:hypothetical protein
MIEATKLQISRSISIFIEGESLILVCCLPKLFESDTVSKPQWLVVNTVNRDG